MPINRKNVIYFLGILMSRVNQILCAKYALTSDLTQALNCHAWFKDQLCAERVWYSLRSAKENNHQNTKPKTNHTTKKK